MPALQAQGSVSPGSESEETVEGGFQSEELVWPSEGTEAVGLVDVEDVVGAANETVLGPLLKKV
jgi:hypothetical protein